ncbi:MAG: adenosine deaminase [Erysipelotrichaceae bacterium]|nr:adenosine deaminase [Erysipelotrichaceae bacterium]
MNYPLVQLHCHLDGAIPYDLFCRYCREMGYVGDDVSDEEWIRQNVMTETMSLAEGLQKFILLTAILQTPEHLEEVTERLLDDLYEEGNRLVELRFAPQSHTKGGMTMEDAVKAVLAGREKAMAKHPDMVSGIILCMMNYGQDWGDRFNNQQTIQLARKYLGQGVVGIDLAGDELATPIEEYRPEFEMAKDFGIPFTIHAGESGPFSNVQFAIDIGATRIGHGVHAIYSEEVVRQLVEKGITLEISITSNIMSRSFNSYAEHPVRKLYDSGVCINLNTDDQELFDITIKDEYEKAREYYYFTETDLIRLNLFGAEASFCPDKDKVVNQLKEILGE